MKSPSTCVTRAPVSLSVPLVSTIMLMNMLVGHVGSTRGSRSAISIASVALTSMRSAPPSKKSVECEMRRRNNLWGGGQ